MIKKLPDEIVSKIAAGQVVEDSSSVVKELIENSLDAKATQILVEIQKAGIKSIRVVDNGVGISKKDITLAPMAHTTSKISTLDDLSSIWSFGFRGEALSSVAAMGNLTIKSRTTKDRHGYEVIAKPEQTGKIAPVGMQKGTIVEVIGLFSKIPARKKNIKLQSTENKRLISIVSSLALIHPDISFKLILDNKTCLNLNTETQRERNENVLGKFISDGLVPISYQTEKIRISGFIGTPQLSIKQKTRQFLYVNKRLITNDSLSDHIKSLYGTLLDPRLNPAYLISIDLSPDLVDVNIHPRKEHVNFLTPQIVFEAIDKAIKPKLENKNLTYSFNLSPKMSNKTAFIIKDSVTKWSVKPEKLASDKILQVDNTFLVTQTNSNLLIIDQHAAHERILYEQFLGVFESKSKQLKSNPLKSPVKITLPIVEITILEDNLEVLKRLGFEFTRSNKTFHLSVVPDLYRKHDLHQLISELVNDLRENNKRIDSLSQRTLSYLACRSAIKSGDELTDKEVKNLVTKLYKTKTNYTCPHGRPVLIEIPLSQLHIAFRRK